MLNAVTDARHRTCESSFVQKRGHFTVCVVPAMVIGRCVLVRAVGVHGFVFFVRTFCLLIREVEAGSARVAAQAPCVMVYLAVYMTVLAAARR